MSRIIDAHSHYIPAEIAQNTAFFKAGWSDLDRQLAMMDQCGIEKSVLLYPTSDAHLLMGGWKKVCAVYNQKIFEVVKKYPDRFIGGGILPPDNAADLTDELKRIADLKFGVISLASSYSAKYLDDEMFYPIFEYAEKSGTPIHVHPQILNPIGDERLRDPLLSPVLEYVFDVSVCLGRMMMNDVFTRFPKTKFIFAHYGGVLPIVKERFDNTYQMLRKRGFVKDLGRLPSECFQNLYFDTSGSRSRASLLAALEVADASHIFFGSDFPANQNLQGSLDLILHDPAFHNDSPKFLFENFQSLLGA